MGVAYGDGSIAILLLHHQLSHWLAYDVASAQNDAFLATGLNIVMLQQGEDTERSGRDETRHAERHSAHVYRVESVYILAVIYCHGYLLLIDVLRQRKLNDESVNIIILVQLVYALQELFFGNILLITDEGRLESTLLAGQHLVFHIGFAASVVPYEHGYQVWLLASVGNNLCHLLGYLFLDGGCRRLSVYKLHLIL